MLLGYATTARRSSRRRQCQLETRLRKAQEQGADLGGVALTAGAAHPPNRHRPERADHELRRQFDRAVVLPRGALGRQLRAHEAAHHRADQPFNGHLALALERRSIERAVAGQVVEERRHEGERLRRSALAHGDQPIAQAPDAGREKCFLVLEMRIEGRAPDPGAVDDVLRGQTLEAALGHQLAQRVEQQASRAGRAAVERDFNSHGGRQLPNDRGRSVR